METTLVALCADAESLRYPDTIGLAGENLAAQNWLRLFSSGEAARRFLVHDQQVDEVWVASSEDVDPINLAATLKRDRRERRVCLLSFQGTGSLRSRASIANIDAILSQQAFVERYRQRKHGHTAHASTSPAATVVPQASAEMPVTPPTFSPTAAPAPRLQVEAASAPAPAFESMPVSAAASSSAVSRPAEAAAHDAFLLPVVSGSGGAGKSTVAVLSALLAQAWGYRTLLLDFDLRFGDMAAMLGARDALTVDEVLAVPQKLDGLKPQDKAPALLAAPRHLEEAEAISGQTGQLLDALRGRFDVIVANTGATWAEEHAVLLERSSKALFLVDQRASSVRACQHALDVCARCGIATGPLQLVVNRCAKNAPLSSIDVSCALRGAHVAELQEGGREVEELLGAGLPLELMQSKNALCTSLEGLLAGMLPGRSDARANEVPAAERRLLPRRLFGNRKAARRRESPCLC